MRILFLISAFILVLASCKKSELEVIPSNTPPPDETISAVTYENYITRAYILVLGREADSIEYNFSMNVLSSAHLDSVSRRTFLNDVFSDPDFRPHVYNENRIDLLNNVDTADFSFWVYIFNMVLQDTSLQIQWPYYQYEYDRMVALQNAFSEYVNDSIQIDELQRRMCNNYLYDQINMGSDNFVISTFQNLIIRNPTTSEQQSSVSMVNGNNATLFLQSGNSKNDYLDIFTHSQSYYEGQVVLMYLKYLNRHPNTVEMAAGTTKYSTTLDYTAVQRDILATDEFIGL